MNENYTLTVIEEIETPLAGSMNPGTNYFVPSAIVILSVAALVASLLYYLECSKYQKRYGILMASQGQEVDSKKCWSIKRLKEMIMEEEAEAVDAFADEEFRLS